jgi:hypothetical protein
LKKDVKKKKEKKNKKKKETKKGAAVDWMEWKKNRKSRVWYNIIRIINIWVGYWVLGLGYNKGSSDKFFYLLFHCFFLYPKRRNFNLNKEKIF